MYKLFGEQNPYLQETDTYLSKSRRYHETVLLFMFVENWRLYSKTVVAPYNMGDTRQELTFFVFV